MRVIQALEAIYMEGLLSPIQFIGEHKGELTIIVAAKFWGDSNDDEYDKYIASLKEVVEIPGDSWFVKVGMFDRSPSWPPHQTKLENLLGLGEEGGIKFVRYIDAMWELGTKEFKRPMSENSWDGLKAQ